jgi:hypothetical protein
MCLVVTEGFRHILEISRQNAPDGFGDSFFWVKPQRLVPPDRVYEVSARIDHRGVALAPLDEELARDRAAVGPWGVAGGRPGGVFGISVNPGTPALREVPAISNGTKMIEGDLVRVETTGGGGWGNPFEREYQYVRRDVIWEKVTFEGAMRHYGVVFSDEKNFKVDPDGSGALRQIMKASRKKGAFFDRGPGFAALKSSAG